MTTQNTINNYLRTRFNSRGNTQRAINNARRYLGTNSKSDVYVWAAKQLERQKKLSNNQAKTFIAQKQRQKAKANASYRAQIETIRTRQVQALTAARRANRLTPTQADRERTLNKILKDLAASDSRIAAAKPRDLSTQEKIQILQSNPAGAKIVRNLQIAKSELTLKGKAPYSKAYRDKIAKTLLELRPSVKEPKGRYGSVRIGNEVFTPETKRQARYTNRLKAVVERDENLKRDWARTIQLSGLNVNKSDKWFVKAYKGAGASGLGLLSSGKFISNATDKLLIAIGSLRAGNAIRSSVKEESRRALKETPKVVAQSLDPRKPENWANILLTAIAINSLAQAKLNTNNLSRLRTAKNKVKEGLKNTKEARVKSSLRTDKKSLTLSKKLLKQEKKLLSQRNKLNKQIKKIQKVEAKKQLRLDKIKAKKQKRAFAKSIKNIDKTEVTIVRFKGKTPKKPTIYFKPKVKKTIVSKVLSTIKGSKGINNIRATKTQGGLKVTTANRQIVLLKEPTSKSVTTKGKTIVTTKVNLKQGATYYKEVLAQVRSGKSVKLASESIQKLHSKFYPLFKTGSVSKIRTLSAVNLGVSPFQKIGVASRIGSISKLSSKSATEARVRSLIKQAQAVSLKIGVLSASKVSVLQVQNLLQKLESIKKNISKARKRLKLKFPRRKKKVNKVVKRNLDELYTKTKKKYRPSLAAIIFGIYGVRPKVITGLEIRPLIKKKTKRKVTKIGRKKRVKKR